MKKIIMFISATMMAAGMKAETLVDFQREIGTITLSGTTTTDAVKIHLNKDGVSGIKFANSYSSDGAMNANYAVVETEGGFKAGDVVTIAGAFNNSDDTKKSAVDLFTSADGSAYDVLFTTQQFINGRTVEGNPVEETFTLTADVDKLYFGRNGNTATFVTVFKVVRGEETPTEPVEEPKLGEGELINFAVTIDGINMNGTCGKSSVKIHANTDLVDCINFANSYKSDNALNGNYVQLATDGGFKAGDVVSIAGVFNNSDDTKLSAIDIFALDAEQSITVLFTTQQFINARTVADDPAVETFTLTEDAETLNLGRQGNTGTNVTTLIVSRSTANGISPLPVSLQTTAAYNAAGQRVPANHKGLTIKDGRKAISK